MTSIEEIRKTYLESAVLRRWAENLNAEEREKGLRYFLKGPKGSQRYFLTGLVAEASHRNLLLVLNDREEALYAQNDLATLLPEHQVVFYPASGKRPYQLQEIDNANVLQRAEVLSVLNDSDPGRAVVVTYPEALYEKVINKTSLVENTLNIARGDELGMEFIEEVLESYGFEAATFVVTPGQYAVRGGIMDVYSFASDYPFRLEFLGDEIDSIRSFDPVDQLSRTAHQQIAILPNVRTHLVTERRVSFLEYIAPSTFIALEDVRYTLGELDKCYEKAEAHYRQLEDSSAGGARQSDPDHLMIDADVFRKQLLGFHQVEIGPQKYFPSAETLTWKGQPQPGMKKDFTKLAETVHQLQTRQGYRVVIFAEQEKQIKRLEEIFKNLEPQVMPEFLQKGLQKGFIDEELKLACFTDHEIFERYHRYRNKEVFRKGSALTLKELTELKPGDFVTHVNHGIARFGGLERIEQGENITEAVRLIFNGGDAVFVNINALYKISKYSGREGQEPKLSKLGSAEWERKKARVKKRVKQLAFDLIELYAKRKATQGVAYSPDNYLQQELEASFLYEDTPDQETATEAVKEDLEKSYPMDRLVCGDVGFGKTEIAIRAAFKALNDGKQVALLVPTTILAMQHYHTFQERFEQFGVRVDFINRFRSRKEQKEILEKTQKGQVEMLIGTHRLLSKDVKFQDLGLLIIDEEHKFGVAAKEKLRLKKVAVDTLTLTATPIPRTLQFSLLGIRDMSIITTPPPNRQPVETSLHSFDTELIRDAVAYEMQRGGQVFFVHNRTKDLQELAAMIKKLVPDCRIAYAHGQMDGEKVEKIMLDFINREYDVLVATTIIEAGLDIPNANTIIINQAQTYGLSDLHQMRGRVGRSNRKAFCYLLAPALHTLPDDSRKRLTALLEFSDLGSGIQIAMRDLDIRGAGDILGAEQSGFINDIGYDMYQKILKESIEEIKAEHFSDTFGEEIQPSTEDCQIDTDQEVLLPADYIPHVSERLSYYKRISEATEEETLQALARELVDRFGLLPPPALALFDTIRIREIARRIGFVRVLQKRGKLRVYLPEDSNAPFYSSDIFRALLDYVKQHSQGSTLRQLRGRLVLEVEQMTTVKQALMKLQHLEAYLKDNATSEKGAFAAATERMESNQ